MKFLFHLSRMNVVDTFRKTNQVLILLALGLILIPSCTPQENLKPSGMGTPTVEFRITEVPTGAQISPEAKPGLAAMKCPALDSQLSQIIQMEDPAGSAVKLGLKVKEDKVQVLITLSDENTAFLADFNAEAGTQSGNQVQAYVPFGQLCLLANVDSVLAIHPSAQAIPLN